MKKTEAQNKQKPKKCENTKIQKGFSKESNEEAKLQVERKQAEQGRRNQEINLRDIR